MSAAVTPSPVRAVRRFEADEAAARKLQQLYDDEVTAVHAQESATMEDEFDAATLRYQEERSQQALKRYGGDQ